MSDFERVGVTRDILGEGPVWCPQEQALYWVDIHGAVVQRWDSVSAVVTRWPMPERVSSLALRDRGGLIVALHSALAFFDPLGGGIQRIARIDAEMRFNDGKCDRQGRFWVGSMTVNEATRPPVGHLYCFDAERGCIPIIGGVKLPNGLCWSPDGATMYFADSLVGDVWAFPFDPASGEVGSRRQLAHVDGPAVPDGATVDELGYVWSTQYGGWNITRYSPDGEIDRIVKLPIQQPTSCAFGGPDLDVLYVTSASRGLSDQELERQPLAGAVLAFKPGVKGLPEPRFAY